MADETKPTPLTHEELEAIQLRCVVCGNEVPRGRATRRKDTCTVECYDKLKQWRKHLQGQRKCNTCLAPYTEKQRAEFRLWRQETGGLRVKRGKPPIAKEEKLSAALVEAEQALRYATNYTRAYLGEYSAEVRFLQHVLGKLQALTAKPVDTAPPESNSIAADHATI
jgi:hypothetical protein